ncbi:MAG: hypothetical protein L0207_00420 [Chlamydiae bacterium]|nr:hypothetical protein [Chlamydiota bacterium]
MTLSYIADNLAAAGTIIAFYECLNSSKTNPKYTSILAIIGFVRSLIFNSCEAHSSKANIAESILSGVCCYLEILDKALIPGYAFDSFAGSLTSRIIVHWHELDKKKV